MLPAIGRNPRPEGHRYVLGTAAEYAALFGCPPPLIPEGESREGREVVQAILPTELEAMAGQYLDDLRQVVVLGEGGRVGQLQEVEERYARFLEELLRHLLRADRRIGLLNLFWLAHGKSLRRNLLEIFSRDPRGDRLKYRLWPILAGFLQRVQRSAFTGLSTSELRTARFNLGRTHAWSLFESITGDQLALTEDDVRRFDPLQTLGAHNPHFTLEGPSFGAILAGITERFNGDLERGDADFPVMIRRRCTGFSSTHDPQGQDRGGKPFLYHPRVLSYYLADPELASQLQKRDKGLGYLTAKLGGWHRVAEEFERVMLAVQRSEFLQFFQESVTLVPAGLDEAEIKGLYQEGRLYRMGRTLPVINNFRTVVILIADIREFTRTSEMAISERELTERLYDVFDPLVHLVNSLGGTIDKFTGDGMMVTFGAVRTLAEPALRALRCAVAIQEAVDRLRAAGRTTFQMGLSLHAGRVFVASLMHDEHEKETTVIGRQVNLAGRLSSSHSTHHDDVSGEDGGDEAFRLFREGLRRLSPSEEGAVSVDAEGNFYNVGVAASKPFIEALGRTVALADGTVDGRRGYSLTDRYLSSELHVRYVGDGRFKGFREAIPVYGISWVRTAKTAKTSGE